MSETTTGWTDDAAQAGRVANAILLGAEGLPQIDYACLAKHYLRGVEAVLRTAAPRPEPGEVPMTDEERDAWQDYSIARSVGTFDQQAEAFAKARAATIRAAQRNDVAKGHADG